MKTQIASAVIVVLSLGLGGCASYGGSYDDRYSDRGDSRYQRGSYAGEPRYRSASNCYDCGVVLQINRFDDGRRSSGVGGAVAGAVIGGVVGSQIGSGSGRDAATVVGAVAGGLAGRDLERNASGGDYELIVRMSSGQQVQVRQRDLDGVREGSRVVIRGGRAQIY